MDTENQSSNMFYVWKILWPERAIGLTQSGISYLHQASCQTLRIGRHLWQEI